jgi:hypothetical protein
MAETHVEPAATAATRTQTRAARSLVGALGLLPP